MYLKESSRRKTKKMEEKKWPNYKCKKVSQKEKTWLQRFRETVSAQYNELEIRRKSYKLQATKLR